MSPYPKNALFLSLLLVRLNQDDDFYYLTHRKGSQYLPELDGLKTDKIVKHIRRICFDDKKTIESIIDYLEKRADQQVMVWDTFIPGVTFNQIPNDIQRVINALKNVLNPQPSFFSGCLKAASQSIKWMINHPKAHVGLLFLSMVGFATAKTYTSRRLLHPEYRLGDAKLLFKKRIEQIASINAPLNDDLEIRFYHTVKKAVDNGLRAIKKTSRGQQRVSLPSKHSAYKILTHLLQENSYLAQTHLVKILRSALKEEKMSLLEAFEIIKASIKHIDKFSSYSANYFDFILEVTQALRLKDPNNYHHYIKQFDYKNLLDALLHMTLKSITHRGQMIAFQASKKMLQLHLENNHWEAIHTLMKENQLETFKVYTQLILDYINTPIKQHIGNIGALSSFDTINIPDNYLGFSIEPQPPVFYPNTLLTSQVKDKKIHLEALQVYDRISKFKTLFKTRKSIKILTPNRLHQFSDLHIQLAKLVYKGISPLALPQVGNICYQSGKFLAEILNAEKEKSTDKDFMKVYLYIKVLPSMAIYFSPNNPAHHDLLFAILYEENKNKINNDNILPLIYHLTRALIFEKTADGIDSKLEKLNIILKSIDVSTHEDVLILLMDTKFNLSIRGLYQLTSIYPLSVCEPIFNAQKQAIMTINSIYTHKNIDPKTLKLFSMIDFTDKLLAPNLLVPPLAPSSSHQESDNPYNASRIGIITASTLVFALLLYRFIRSKTQAIVNKRKAIKRKEINKLMHQKNATNKQLESSILKILFNNNKSLAKKFVVFNHDKNTLDDYSELKTTNQETVTVTLEKLQTINIQLHQKEITQIVLNTTRAWGKNNNNIDTLEAIIYKQILLIKRKALCSSLSDNFNQRKSTLLATFYKKQRSLTENKFYKQLSKKHPAAFKALLSAYQAASKTVENNIQKLSPPAFTLDYNAFSQAWEVASHHLESIDFKLHKKLLESLEIIYAIENKLLEYKTAYKHIKSKKMTLKEAEKLDNYYKEFKSTKNTALEKIKQFFENPLLKSEASYLVNNKVSFNKSKLDQQYENLCTSFKKQLNSKQEKTNQTRRSKKTTSHIFQKPPEKTKPSSSTLALINHSSPTQELLKAITKFKNELGNKGSNLPKKDREYFFKEIKQLEAKSKTHKEPKFVKKLQNTFNYLNTLFSIKKLSQEKRGTISEAIPIIALSKAYTTGLIGGFAQYQKTYALILEQKNFKCLNTFAHHYFKLIDPKSENTFDKLQRFIFEMKKGSGEFYTTLITRKLPVINNRYTHKERSYQDCLNDLNLLSQLFDECKKLNPLLEEEKKQVNNARAAAIMILAEVLKNLKQTTQGKHCLKKLSESLKGSATFIIEIRNKTKHDQTTPDVTELLVECMKDKAITLIHKIKTIANPKQPLDLEHQISNGY